VTQRHRPEPIRCLPNSSPSSPRLLDPATHTARIYSVRWRAAGPHRPSGGHGRTPRARLRALRAADLTRIITKYSRWRFSSCLARASARGGWRSQSPLSTLRGGAPAIRLLARVPSNRMRCPGLGLVTAPPQPVRHDLELSNGQQHDVVSKPAARRSLRTGVDTGLTAGSDPCWRRKSQRPIDALRLNRSRAFVPKPRRRARKLAACS